MHFALLLLLLISTFVHPMEREVVQEKENTSWLTSLSSSLLSKILSIFNEDKGPTPEDKLRVLAQVIRKQKKFPSLKELTLVAIATKKNRDPEFARKLANLPADLHDPVKQAFITHHMVEILNSFPLEPSCEYIGVSYKICPKKRYLFSTDCPGLEREGFQGTGKAFELLGGARVFLGEIAAVPFSISYDSKYAAMYKNHIVSIISLPDLKEVTSPLDFPSFPFCAIDKYIIFNPISGTCSSLEKGTQEYGFKDCAFYIDAQETSTLDPEMYIFNAEIAHQWKHYILAKNDCFEELAAIAYVNNTPNLIADYWNEIFYSFLRAKGIKNRMFYLPPTSNPGAFSTNGAIFVKSFANLRGLKRFEIYLQPEEEFLCIKPDSLSAFPKKNDLIFSPEHRESRDISRLEIHGNGHLLLIQGDSRRGTDWRKHSYLYDSISKKECILLKYPGRDAQYFWFNPDEDAIEIYAGTDRFRYDLKRLLPYLSLQILVGLVRPRE